MRRRVLIFTWALLITTRLFAAELPPEMIEHGEALATPRALRVVIDDPWMPPQPTLEIPIGDEPQLLTLEIPPQPVPKGKLLSLRFRVRMQSKGFGGWNHFLQIRLNDKLLGYYTVKKRAGAFFRG